MNVRRNSSPSPSTLSCPTTAIAKKPWEEQSQVLDVIISSKEKWVAQVIKVCATLHLILWFYLELVILNIYLTVAPEPSSSKIEPLRSFCSCSSLCSYVKVYVPV